MFAGKNIDAVVEEKCKRGNGKRRKLHHKRGKLPINITI